MNACEQAGKSIVLEVEPGDTIEKLKIRIREKESISLEGERLVFADKVLEARRTLTECNIQNGSTVYLESSCTCIASSNMGAPGGARSLPLLLRICTSLLPQALLRLSAAIRHQRTDLWTVQETRLVAIKRRMMENVGLWDCLSEVDRGKRGDMRRKKGREEKADSETMIYAARFTRQFEDSTHPDDPLPWNPNLLAAAHDIIRAEKLLEKQLQFSLLS